MKCDICHINDAVIHIQQSNGKVLKNLHLCQSCAEERGINQDNPGIDRILSGLFSNILKDVPVAFQGVQEKQKSEIITCPNCNLDISILSKESKAGCAYCYNYLELENSKNDFMYSGNIPKKFLDLKNILYELPKLKEELNSAIENEDYESANSIKLKIEKFRRK